MSLPSLYSFERPKDFVQENYDYDRDKFVRYSGTSPAKPDPVTIAASLTIAYHGIEKGLSMENTRPGFAVPKIQQILKYTRQLEAAGYDCLATQASRGSMAKYVQWHDERGHPLPAELERDIRAFVAENKQYYPGGAVKLTKADIEQAADFDYSRFVNTRYSVRHFTGEPVTPEQIEKAVSIAIKTPRSCNRETRRVYVAYDQDLRDEILTHQDGNRGFGNKLGALLIITADVREFVMIGERTQMYTDGGLFTMSLTYALHSMALGTCFLNWSADCDQDKSFRAAFDIEDHELIITMLGVGQLPDEFDVCASPAPEVGDILSEITRRT